MKMKPNTFILFYAIFVLFLSLISSSVNDSPKRENYIVLTYANSFSLDNQIINAPNSSIDKLIIANTSYNGIHYDVKENDTLEIHFKEVMTNLSRLFRSGGYTYHQKIKIADFSHFDSSSVKDMSYLFDDCWTLQALILQILILP